ncbi:MAG: uroporphyrinogen decarboxylase [Chloroflexi bacterium]|jgi:uroporphyrinogen decarboxylase|nr:uroporphyrinogen decarboxylase [Chloroflexota bacterium]
MPDWSKRKRLEATISGEKPDRLPVSLWRHWPGDDQDAASLAAAHLQWQRDYDWDLLKVGPASSYSVADWGVKDRWVGHIEGTRERIFYPVKEAADWERLRPLDPTKGMLAIQIEALRLVGAALDERVPFIATIFSPLAQAKHLAGTDRLLAHMRSDPELFHQGLETITKSTLQTIEAAKATGISGIFYAVQHARYPLMNPSEFLEFARPYDLQILEATRDLWLNMSHIHGDQIMFDQVADYPVEFVNWHDRETGFSIAAGLAQIPGAASGGIDHWSIHADSPEKTLNEAMDAVKQTNGRRLLLGTGCVIMTTTPLRNIRALREFAAKQQ